MRCNDFETLPEGILGLIRVKWINLENSNMNSLPDGIGGMKELESIYLRYNKLRTLPHVFLLIYLLFIFIRVLEIVTHCYIWIVEIMKLKDYHQPLVIYRIVLLFYYPIISLVLYQVKLDI